MQPDLPSQGTQSATRAVKTAGWTPAKKTIFLMAIGFSLLFILLSLPNHTQDNLTPPLQTNSLTSPNFDTPEHAVETLLAAYQAKDIDAIVAAKDFALDSRLFLEGLGLPTNQKQKTNSEAAFEANFRKQLKADGIPDYRGLKYSLVRQIQSQSNFVILMLEGQLPDGRPIHLRLPTIQVEKEWKAVLAPGYDHL